MNGLFRKISSPEIPPPVIAELSGNHNQNLDTAKNLIQLAAGNGASAVKLQTYTADTLTLPSRSPEFMIKEGLWKGRSLYELYQAAATPYDWHRPLADLARSLGIALFSTPFDETAVDFLESEINPEIYKVSSFEVTHIPLLKRIGQTGKPVILSTGMASLTEIEEAANTLKKNGSGPLVLLKCISQYPSSPDGFNLRSISTLQTRFQCYTGLSDHTLGNEVALGATTLGARVIEKHFTDHRKNGGIDAPFSIEPAELGGLVQQIETLHKSLGSSTVGTTSQEKSQTRFRRSIYIAEEIKAGQTLTKENLKVVRPDGGLEPHYWEQVLGCQAARVLAAHSPLQKGDWIEP